METQARAERRNDGDETDRHEEENNNGYLDNEDPEKILELNQIEVNKTLLDIIITSNIYLLLGALAWLFVLMEGEPSYLLLPLFLEDLYRICFNWYYCKKFTGFPEKLHGFFWIFEAVLLITFKVLLAIHITYYQLNLIITMIPLFIFAYTRYYFCMCDSNRLECTAITDMCLAFFRCFLAVQTLLIVLKIEKVLDWEWPQILSLSWFFVAIIFGIFVGILCTAATRVIAICRGEGEDNELRVICWMLYVIAGAGTLFGVMIMILGTTLTITQDKEIRVKDTAPFQTWLGCLCFFLTGVIILTAAFRSALAVFFQQLALPDDDEDDIEDPEKEDAASRRRPKKIKPKRKLFLKKLSSTYFQHTNEKPNEKARKKKLQESKSSWMDFFSRKSDKTSMNSKEIIQSTNVDLQPTSTRGLVTLANKMSEGDVVFSSPKKLAIGYFHDMKEFKENRYRFEESISPREHNPLPSINERNGSHSFMEGNKEDAIVEISVRNDRTFDIRGRKKIQLAKAKPLVEILKSQGGLPNKNPLDNVRDAFTEKSGCNCLICFDKPADAVLMECGHGGMCYDCAMDMLEKSNQCYLCRNPIVQVLQIETGVKDTSIINVVAMSEKIGEGDGQEGHDDAEE